MNDEYKDACPACHNKGRISPCSVCGNSKSDKTNNIAHVLAELSRSDNDPNRRNGVTVKKTWQFADDPDKGSRTIYVTINRDTCGGKICQVLVSGTSAHAKSGSMLQSQFDLATFFITRLIQHGEDPREMLAGLVSGQMSPNCVITERTLLEVAVLQAVVEEMDNGQKN